MTARQDDNLGRQRRTTTPRPCNPPMLLHVEKADKRGRILTTLVTYSTRQPRIHERRIQHGRLVWLGPRHQGYAIMRLQSGILVHPWGRQSLGTLTPPTQFLFVTKTDPLRSCTGHPYLGHIATLLLKPGSLSQVHKRPARSTPGTTALTSHLQVYTRERGGLPR